MRVSILANVGVVLLEEFRFQIEGSQDNYNPNREGWELHLSLDRFAIKEIY